MDCPLSDASKVRTITLLTASLLIMGSLVPGASASPISPQELPDHVPGEIVVSFAPGAPAAARRAVRSELRLRSLAREGSLGVGLMKLPRGLDVEEAVEALEDEPAVSFAEPNYIYRVEGVVTPDDPHYPSQWALGDGPGSIDAPDAWAVTTGTPGRVIAVVDTGVDLGHPDLSPNLWVNPGEVPNNGIDDDLNGYVDDVHGYDWADIDSDPSDGHGHGTHVAGIAAARGNDAIGVAGTAWNVRIMALRALNDSGAGTSLQLARAFSYAAQMGAQVVNASVGGGGYSLTLEQAIQDSPGTLFVAAAGNGGSDGSGDDNDTTPTYPCSYPQTNIVCVAASDKQDALAAFSNYGSSSVDIAAPGTGILSTYSGNRYATASGTSMAAPFASGVAALLWSAMAEADVETVKGAVLAGAAPSASLEGRVASGGRLSALGALVELGVPPAQETAPEPEETTPAPEEETAPPPEEEEDAVSEPAEPTPTPSPVVEEPSEEEPEASLDSSARVVKKRFRLRVKGWVAPGQNDSDVVKVVLKKKRRSGRFRRLAIREAALDLPSDGDRSLFRTGFRRPNKGRCRLITHFRDDTTGERTRTRTTFRC